MKMHIPELRWTTYAYYLKAMKKDLASYKHMLQIWIDISSIN